MLRVVSAIVLAAFAVYVTWIGGETFALMMLALSLLVLIEAIGILSSTITTSSKILIYAFWIIAAIAVFTTNVMYAGSLCLVAILCLLVLDLFARKVPWSAFAFAYALLPFVSLIGLRGSHPDGFVLVILLFFCVWATDSFGYIVGKPVGGPKLAPTISPNKTWSGFIGGLIGSLVVTAIVASLFEKPVTSVFFVVFFLVSLISQLGDLLESWIKRAFDVKDSGNLIPGHGGVLDRVDGLIAAALAFAVFSLSLANIQLSGFLVDLNLARPITEFIFLPNLGASG